MKQDYLLKTIPVEKYDILTKEELVTLYEEELKTRNKLQKEIDKMRLELNKTGQKSLFLSEEYANIKRKVFGRSSEKSERPKDKKSRANQGSKRSMLPSKKYPNMPIEDIYVSFAGKENCLNCGEEMIETSMEEVTEELTIIPQKFIIKRYHKMKVKCNCCHTDISTPSLPPKIIPGSSYSDDFIIDVSLTKFLDLIPIERYVAIAKRLGVEDLPQNTLLGLAKSFSQFLTKTYERYQEIVLSSEILFADESPIRVYDKKNAKGKMKKSYLWEIASPQECFFEVHATRSSDVIHDHLVRSDCLYFMTDALSTYEKLIKKINVERKKKNLQLITHLMCNSHSRRKFYEAKENGYHEANFFLKGYKIIYFLQSLLKIPIKERDFFKSFDYKKIRNYQTIIFKIMKEKSLQIRSLFSSQSSLIKAVNYFLNHYNNFTYFLEREDLPICNNLAERNFRSPAVGRKTWLGHQTLENARAAAKFFTICESSKMSNTNCREYIPRLVKDIHQKKPPYTAREYNKLKELESVELSPILSKDTISTTTKPP